MDIEKGWCFYTADFSMQAAGRSKTGRVMLCRDLAGVKEWHKLGDDLKDSDAAPPLFVQGTGVTVGEAVVDANQEAASAVLI